MDDATPQSPKTLTVAQAAALLPDVRRLVTQLQGLQRSIIKTNQQLDELIGKLSTGNGYPIQAIRQKIQELTKHQLQLIEAFQSSLKQLEDLGAVLKDVEMGLVDFYSVRNGDMICLCWKLEEDRIRFWHAVDEGYAGRRPL